MWASKLGWIIILGATLSDEPYWANVTMAGNQTHKKLFISHF